MPIGQLVFELIGFGARLCFTWPARQVRLMHRKTAALEGRLQEQNRVAAIRTQEAARGTA